MTLSNLLPDKRDNIYSKCNENILALLHHYFDAYDLPVDDAVQQVMGKPSLSLNQVEYIVKMLSFSWPAVFNKRFEEKDAVRLMLMYGFAAFTLEEEAWPFGPHSKARPKIKEFIQFVENENGKAVETFEVLLDSPIKLIRKVSSRDRTD